MRLFLLFTLVLVGVSIWISPLPYLGAFALLSLFFAALSAHLEKRVVRIATLNLFILFLLFTILEGTFLFREQNRKISKKHDYPKTGRYTRFEPILGRRPGESGRVSLQYDDKVVYDVEYTLDPYGWRILPEPTEKGLPAVVFFGGSFTYGEGVQNEEAFCYLVADKIKSKFRTLNFSYHGYGANQMLTCLEEEIVEESLQGSSPEFVFYVPIPDHAQRAVARNRWSGTAPEYVIEGNGKLRRAGTFYDWDPLWPAIKFRLRLEQNRSALGRRLAGPSKKGDIEVWKTIVKASQEKVKENWPNARFVVLFWANRRKEAATMREALQGEGLEVVDIETEYPDLLSHRIPHDVHPNTQGHRMVADLILKRFFQSSLSETSD